MSRRVLFAALLFVCATAAVVAADPVQVSCPRGDCHHAYIPDDAEADYLKQHCSQLSPGSDEATACYYRSRAHGSEWVQMITAKCEQCCGLIGKLNPFNDCSMFFGGAAVGEVPQSNALGSIESASASSSIIYNCAWARAEMKRCADAYNENHSDDEYEACIRVPSATIQNDPKCTFPSDRVGAGARADPSCRNNCAMNRAMCGADQQTCNQLFAQCKLKCGLAVAGESASEVEAVAVTSMRDCVKECKNKGKDAANKCKHEKFARRAQCYAQVPNTVKACESGCTRKPHVEADALAVDAPRPLLGDCQPCDAIYDQCLPACNGMNSCHTRCMETHFDCRMKTPGC